LRNALLLNPVEGRTALYDALNQAMDHMNSGVREKKTLVLISDGKDNMSKTTREEILQRVQSSPVTIYAVGIYDADQRDKDPKFLKQLATLTGGTAHFPGTQEELLAACRNIATEIRNRYTLGFVPGPEIPDGKPQKLVVTASGENGVKLKVHARPSYMRMPAKSQAKAK
jgi:VWFA-related protein